MAAIRRIVPEFLARSSFGGAVVMTLMAVCLAGLLPLGVQAQPPQAVVPAQASSAIRTHDATMSTPHERNW